MFGVAKVLLLFLTSKLFLTFLFFKKLFPKFFLCSAPLSLFGSAKVVVHFILHKLLPKKNNTFIKVPQIPKVFLDIVQLYTKKHYSKAHKSLIPMIFLTVNPSPYLNPAA